MFVENLRIALKALWANRMRSMLTTLGMIIGVASVIAVVSLVQGMQHLISAELEGVGATYIRVIPDAGEERRSIAPVVPELTYDDGRAVVRQATEIREFTPLMIRSVETRFREQRHDATLLGVSESYQDVVNHWVDHGRFFTPLDMEARAAICTVGREVVKKLAVGGDPLGKQMLINGKPFTIVGIMEKKGSAFGQDQDDIVLIPFPTASQIFGAYTTRHLVLDFQARRAERIDLAKQQISDVLRSRHRLKKGSADDFRIILQEELIKTVSKAML